MKPLKEQLKDIHETAYSSPMVEALMTNEVWNFWSAGWKSKIMVEWNPAIPVEKFSRKIASLLKCRNFMYERSVNAAMGHAKAQYRVVQVNGKVELVVL